jgi:hypothetical protein
MMNYSDRFNIFQKFMQPKKYLFEQASVLIKCLIKQSCSTATFCSTLYTHVSISIHLLYLFILWLPIKHSISSVKYHKKSFNAYHSLTVKKKNLHSSNFFIKQVKTKRKNLFALFVMELIRFWWKHTCTNLICFIILYKI